MWTILIVAIVLMLLGATPTWPHSRSWAYARTVRLALNIVIVFVLTMTGRL